MLSSSEKHWSYILEGRGAIPQVEMLLCKHLLRKEATLQGFRAFASGQTLQELSLSLCPKSQVWRMAGSQLWLHNYQQRTIWGPYWGQLMSLNLNKCQHLHDHRIILSLHLIISCKRDLESNSMTLQEKSNIKTCYYLTLKKSRPRVNRMCQGCIWLNSGQKCSWESNLYIVVN